jgi:O-antigen/teichoic acid export membrane protein
MNRLRRSIVLSAMNNYGELLLTLLSITILSRLLTPHEFGVYAITTSVPGVLSAVREFGGANYIIQKQDLLERCVRTSFTINCAISAALIAILFATRDEIASFFGEEGVRVGIAVAALNFVFLPFAETVSALLRREMAFHVIAVCNLVAATAMLITSISLAAAGFSFMGPVWGIVAGSATQAVLFCAYRRDPCMFLLCLDGWRNVLRFGVYSTGTVIITNLNQWSPQVILARVLDFTAVGLYARSVNIMVMFDRLVTDVLKPVILPAMTVHAGDLAALKRFYLEAIELISGLQWPFMVVVALLAEPIVGMLFGSGWAGAVPLARLLAVASLATFAACLTYPMLVAVGRVRDALLVNLLSIPPSLLLLSGAAFLGINWVAASALISLPLQAGIAWWFIRKHVGIVPLELARAARKSAIVTTCTAVPVLVILAGMGFPLAIPFPLFIAAGVSAAGAWWAGVVITRHPIRTHVQVAFSGAAVFFFYVFGGYALLLLVALFWSTAGWRHKILLVIILASKLTPTYPFFWLLINLITRGSLVPTAQRALSRSQHPALVVIPEREPGEEP